MARNAIKSEFRTSKMADQSEMARHPKWPPKKINLYRSEMARIAIESEFRKSRMADRSEMARNVIQSEFLCSRPEVASSGGTGRGCILPRWKENGNKKMLR